jgi:hypothetical protein
VYGHGEGGGADPFGLGLAECIQRELAATSAEPVRVGEARIGMLDPRHHGEGVAACLVEAGSLADPDDERRLGHPETLDRIGAAIARGVERYFGNASEDDANDPEDTDGPAAKGYALEDGDSEDEDRFGSPHRPRSNGAANGVHAGSRHHESY